MVGEPISLLFTLDEVWLYVYDELLRRNAVAERSGLGLFRSIGDTPLLGIRRDIDWYRYD